MRRRQIAVLALVLMIIAAGVIQFGYDKSNLSAERNDDNLGEALFVENQIEDSNSDGDKEGEAQETLANNDFFVLARMERNTTRDKEKEDLKKITEDKNAEEEIQKKAYNNMLNIVKTSEKEMKIESLIKQRGFGDALVYFAEDNSVDIIVKADSLSKAQTAQLCDIVLRQTQSEFDDIHIRNMK